MLHRHGSSCHRADAALPGAFSAVLADGESPANAVTAAIADTSFLRRLEGCHVARDDGVPRETADG